MAYNVSCTMTKLNVNTNLGAAYLDDDSAVSRTVRLLITNAIKAKATTLHIEPWENNVGVRYRIDGILRHANKLPKETLSSIVSRIKLLAKLDIEPQPMPQEGQFQINIASKMYNIVVTILPVADGENVVLRIQNQSEKPKTLEKLGFWGPSLGAIEHILRQNSGLVLVSGPAGSGKSTTLYGILSILNTPGKHISTVQNIVKYKIPQADQQQINQKIGTNYTASLKSILRTNPDILMIDYIGEKMTAELCIQAAKNGKLVFASTHTNETSNCIPWIANLGIDPPMLAISLRAIIGQRLVRKLCVACKIATKPKLAELKQIADYFDIASPTAFSQIHQFVEIFSAKKDANLPTTETKINKLWRASFGGCNKCNHTGYKGRIGLFEVLENNPGIQRLIIGNPSNQTIQAEATKNGMLPLKTDGLIKALCGQTTIAEVMQATK